MIFVILILFDKMAEIRKTVDAFDNNTFKDNKEAFELRKIFNALEENQLKKKSDVKKKIYIFDKYDDKENLNINILANLEIRPKNRYKLKLQKLLIKKHL